MEFTLLFAAGTAMSMIWLANRLRRSRYPDWLERPTDLLVGSAAVGMLVGRLAAMVAAGVNPMTHPFDILLVRGGVHTGFATVGAIGALGWASRSRVPAVLDLLAPAALSGLGGWHAGCLWRGTCLGVATDLPWGMTIDGSAVTRHPVELYAAVALFVAALVVARLPLTPWVPAGAALAGAAAVRLLSEPLRLSVVGGPVMVYSAGIVLGVLVFVFGLARGRRPVTT